jgi:hypothetical protein
MLYALCAFVSPISTSLQNHHEDVIIDRASRLPDTYPPPSSCQPAMSTIANTKQGPRPSLLLAGVPISLALPDFFQGVFKHPSRLDLFSRDNFALLSIRMHIRSGAVILIRALKIGRQFSSCFSH